jgi:methionyl-tRNA formyltransferase
MNSPIAFFLGTERGLRVLKTAIDNKLNISFVIILKQQNHELNNYFNQIQSLCEINDIYWKSSSEVKPADYESFLTNHKVSALFVISWRYLIPKTAFLIPNRGVFIIHDSLLPKYRGFAPTNWVIINGEKSTGLTLQCIDEGTDSGDIIDQIKIQISKNETATSLNDKFLKLYPRLFMNNVYKILNNKFSQIKQDNKKATFACKRTPSDGKINFYSSTIIIDRLIRGLSYPYPGAFCNYDGQKIIVWEAQVIHEKIKYVGRIPGVIIKIGKDGVEVLTGDGTIKIIKVSKYEEPSIFLNASTVFNSMSKKLE